MLLLIQALAFWLTSLIVPGVQVGTIQAGVAAAVVLGILNLTVRPILLAFTLPFTILTFGLSTFVLNAGALITAALIVNGFSIAEPQTVMLWTVLLTLINGTVLVLFNLGEKDSFYVQLVRRAVQRRAGVSDDFAEPGLVVVQIDGLSSEAFGFAAKAGLAPTLARWVSHGSHRIIDWECSLPSMTSASQAGILHGNNFDIPAFRWFEKDSGHLIVSTRPEDAAEILHRVSDGRGLLGPHGSCVNGLMSGDAGRSVGTLSTLVSGSSKPAHLYFYFLNPDRFVRSMIRMLREVFLEIHQSRRQEIRGVDPRVGRKGAYPIVRSFTTVLLADITSSLVTEDIFAGVPVVFCNYMGYDEVAHYAGPERHESLGALGDIDHEISKLEEAVKDAPRPYNFIVLSDHGQTQGATFMQRHGEPLENVIASLIGKGKTVFNSNGTTEGWANINALLTETIQSFGAAGKLFIKSILRSRAQHGYVRFGPDRRVPSEIDADVVISASGCLAMVYLTQQPVRMTRKSIEESYPGLIAGLAAHPGVGLVMVRSEEKGGVVVGPKGFHELESGYVEGEDPLRHLGSRAAEHLRRLDEFPHVGDIVINGTFYPETGETTAFEEQVGSHGGLGGSQMKPFLLVPSQLEEPDTEVVGAPAVYELLKKWKAQLSCRTDTPPVDDLGASKRIEHVVQT
jgi:uncharacterized membrane protein YvlD (DUF360 family)